MAACSSVATDRLQVLSGHLKPSTVNMSRAPITTHVLDTARGMPASGVPITLSYLSSAPNSTWTVVGTGTTNQDGRCPDLLTSVQLHPGTYRIHFDTNSYFSSLGNHEPFYPYVEVVFNLRDVTQHYHVPLLLSPYSYSTYRGS